MQVCTSLQTDNHANTPPLSSSSSSSSGSSGIFIYVRASLTRRNQLTNGEAQKRRLLIGLHLEGEYAEDDDAAVVQYVRDAVQSGGVLVVLVLTSDLKPDIQSSAYFMYLSLPP